MRPDTLLIRCIRLYQKAVSPYLGNHCRFHPTCSEYMAIAISMNGCLKGVFQGIGRILRCHPFHPGGVDEPRRFPISGMRDSWKNG